jgi:hypothetical protein
MKALPPSPEPGKSNSSSAPLVPPAAVDFIGEWGVSIAALAILAAMFAILAVQGIRRRRT